MDNPTAVITPPGDLIKQNLDIHVLRADPVFSALDGHAKLAIELLDKVLKSVNELYPLPADYCWMMMGDNHLYPRYCPSEPSNE